MNAEPGKNARAQADDFAAEFIQKFPHAVVDRNHLGAWFHTMMQVGAEMVRAKSAAGGAPEEPKLTERDENIICGIIVGSFLNFEEKERLCGLVRALNEGASPAQEEG